MNAPIASVECGHSHLDIRALTCSNGAIQYVYQCFDCGARVGGAISKAEVFRIRGPLDLILPFDESAREHGRSLLQEQRRVIAVQATDERRAVYAAYLDSPEWRAKRVKVMKRAGGVCEGCLDARATEVHHRTYAHIYQEFMFELIALCEPCHQRIHEGRVDE